NWQSRWSHHPGRNQVTLVPCSWQTTREKLDQITAGWPLSQRHLYASQMLELQYVRAQKAQAVAAIAEAAHPVAEADRPTGHTGPLEPFTTILDDTDQPLREWAVDFDSPDDTNVWIRRDDTLQEGRVVIGEPTVNVELECAGTLQFSPDDADHLAGAIRAAARAVRAQVQESVTKENVVTRALRGSAALGDYLTLTAVLAHDDHLTLIVDDEFSRSTHRVGFDDALEASRLFSEMARIGRPSSMRANLRFVELDATDIS
ncbi:hypothetical protein R3P93_20085, partial [Rhodococcus cerastii]